MVGSSAWPWANGGLDLFVGTHVRVFLPAVVGGGPVMQLASVIESKQDSKGWVFKVMVNGYQQALTRIFENVRPQEMMPIAYGFFKTGLSLQRASLVRPGWLGV